MASATSPWSELLPELLGRVIAELLPFPADLARFRAVCRAWRSAVRHHVRQLPWIVLPDASFCTIGGGDDDDLVHRIPGLPENVTCLGSAGDGWLALDRTDDLYRRTPYHDKFVDNSTFSRPNADAIMHRHTYMLHNPFSGETMPLPELDSLIGHVAVTFEIRKVLMRSASPDDIVAVTTNNCDCNVILCHPGKGRWVVPYLRVCDVAFHGGRLYGITPEEELVAFDLADEDKDGRPIVTKYKRVIRQTLADGEEDPWSYMYDEDDEEDDNDDEDDDNEDDDDPDNDDNSSDNDDDEQSANVEEESDDDAPNQKEEDSSFSNGDSDDNNDDDDLTSINEDDDDDDDDVSDDEDEEDEDEEESSDDDEASDQEVEYSLSGDDRVPDDVDLGTDYTVPYKPKDYTSVSRHLVESCEGRDLLMIRHQTQAPPYSRVYTRKVEVFKADIEGGKWVPATTNALAQGEALFLSRSFCKCTRAYGDIQEGFIFYGYGRCVRHQILDS